MLPGEVIQMADESDPGWSVVAVASSWDRFPSLIAWPPEPTATMRTLLLFFWHKVPGFVVKYSLIDKLAVALLLIKERK